MPFISPLNYLKSNIDLFYDSVEEWRPEVHLGLFVHRVEGLASGLYMLVCMHDYHISVAIKSLVYGSIKQNHHLKKGV